MKTLKDAIELILSQPPEPHYPSYYADLLREADVPDKDVGKCSEIPNSSETIYRQAAIEAVMDEFKKIPTNAIRAKTRLEELPPAQPEISMLTVTVAPSPEDIERVVRKIKDEPITVSPPVQPERKKGKWIKEDSIYGTVTCSVCYGVRRDNRINHINFCNCCGADMRGEQE